MCKMAVRRVKRYAKAGWMKYFLNWTYKLLRWEFLANQLKMRRFFEIKIGLRFIAHY